MLCHPLAVSYPPLLTLKYSTEHHGTVFEALLRCSRAE